jgi:hypothetical protein
MISLILMVNAGRDWQHTNKRPAIDGSDDEARHDTVADVA